MPFAAPAQHPENLALVLALLGVTVPTQYVPVRFDRLGLDDGLSNQIV